MKPKILILTPWYPRKDSPVNGIFVQQQANTLSKEYDVFVLHIDIFSWRSLMKSSWTPQPNSQLEDCGNIQVLREISFNSLPRTIFAYRLYLATAKRGFEKILKVWGKPNIIHAHVLLPGGWVASEIGKEYDIPVVLTEHYTRISEQLTKGFQRSLGLTALQRLDNVVSVSPALEKTILSFYPDIKTTVIGNVIDTNFFYPSQHQCDNLTKKFLTVALLDKRKGINFLIEAAHNLLHKGYQSFEIIIGGDGVERVRLESKVEKLGLSKYFRFLGLLSSSEVRHWMQQCDVFVMPSLFETFCIVLAEAMACGKPVISTYCGGPEFIVLPDTGTLVEPGNSISLAQAMEKFILGEIKYEPDYIRQTIIDRFSQDSFIKNINAVYQPLLGKR